MALYHTIQEKLTQLNDAQFEHLCNDFLPQWRPEFRNFTSNTVVGKTKTRKGKPDAYVTLANGSFVLIEYTTTAKSSLIGKLESDLKGCIKLAQTKFKRCKINRIVLCFNNRINPVGNSELHELARSKGHFLELVNLDKLSKEIQKYPPILGYHLGIHLPLSQFLSPNEFVKQSVHRKFSTSFTNPFVGRDKEIEEINQAMNEEDILFITGKSGVGKTRISLEALSRRYKFDKNVEVYCLRYKGSTKLREEILNIWDRSKRLVLLIDDANYVKEGLLPIMNLQEEAGKGKIKVLLTVRDYVFTETQKAVKEFKFGSITIPPISNKEFEEILKNPPFKLHFRVVDRIERITKGNTRLAMMLAEIVSKERNWSAFDSSTDIYHKYFEEHINESLLKEKDVKATMALLWLFHDFNIGDEELYLKIENSFGLSGKRIWEIIEQLNESEILEVYAKEIAKIPEQTLGGYLFYYVFFHEKILDLKTLFTYFYDSHKGNIFSRIRDSIEVFDYEKVKTILVPVLKETWERVKNDDIRAEDFLNEYWFIFPNKTLSYAKAKIMAIPYPEERVYKAEYTNSGYYTRDHILKLLGSFLSQTTNDYEVALELILEYVERKPEFAGELTKFLVDSIGYDFDDEKFGYYRQKALIKILTQRMKAGNAALELWFVVALKFLNTEFSQASSKRGHALSLYRYNTPLDKTVSQVRKSILKTLTASFNSQPQKAFSFFKTYSQGGSRISMNAYKHDLPFIKKIIESKLNNDDLMHCYLVEDIYRYFKQNKVYNFSKERAAFQTSKFKMLQVCDYKRLDGVEDYIIAKKKYENFNELKRQEIRRKIIIKNIEQFSEFYSIIQIGVSTGIIKSYFLSDCVNTVLQEIRKNNFELFVECLSVITSNKNEIGFSLGLQFSESDEAKQEFDTIFNALSGATFTMKEEWLSILFWTAPSTFLTLEHWKCYMSFFKSGKSNFSASNELLEKFESIKKGFITVAVESFVAGYQNYKNNVRFDTDFVKRFSTHFERNMNTLVQFYFVREEIYERYDYNGEDFLVLTQKLPSFPIQYLSWCCRKYKTDFVEGRHEYDFLGRLWTLPKSEHIIEDVLNFLISKRGLWLIGEYPVNSLFKPQGHLPDFPDRVKRFLLAYTKKNFLIVERMNSILNVCHHTIPELYNQVVKTYLMKSKILKDFKKIKWTKKYGIVSGGVIWGELYSKDWTALLDIVKEVKPKLDYIEHVGYIEEQIILSEKSAVEERKEKFADEWYD